MEVGSVSGGFQTGLLMLRVAFAEDGEHAQAAVELNVRPRVEQTLGCGPCSGASAASSEVSAGRRGFLC